MPVIIGIITALASLFWALSAMRNAGIHLSDLNPFVAMRRWRWRREYGAKPIFKLEKPMDAAAVLLVAIAKADGAISTQQKQLLLQQFESTFEINSNTASQLLTGTLHILRDELSIVGNIDKVLQRSSNRFEPQQAQQLIAMMHRVAAFDTAVNHEQQQILDQTEAFFHKLHSPQPKWQ
jgi:uncharacterized tellurite resistance protein B-like protein